MGLGKGLGMGLGVAQGSLTAREASECGALSGVGHERWCWSISTDRFDIVLACTDADHRRTARVRAAQKG